jgi:TPR repeat protein
VIPIAATLPPPATPDELRQVEALCYEKNPDQCQRAALAHETGSAGATSAAEGKRFRRIALTFYVRECESGMPHACFVLAAMYRRGDFVEKSERRAISLLDRALELCRHRDAEECRAAGPR